MPIACLLTLNFCLFFFEFLSWSSQCSARRLYTCKPLCKGCNAFPCQTFQSLIVDYVTTPLLRLANLYQGFQQTAISIERIGDILNNVQESTKEDKFNIPLPPIKGKVSYDDLSFRFNKKGPLQLSQVSLEIKEGEFVAIVGQSGSGKSTLMKLLSRLYDPDSGKISIAFLK